MNNQIKYLKNIKIVQKEDRNFNNYYIIFDQDNNEAYFCFDKTVKEGWENFKNNWNEISEIEFEFETTEKGNKVVGVHSHNKTDDLLI